MTDHHLERFVTAQADSYPAALTELRGGRKRTHWMWWVFPQLAGLGRSDTARFYAVASLAEARAYLAHPLLGARLHEVTAAVLPHRDRSAEALFGGVDAAKFRSSLTLFLAAGAGAPLDEALRAFFAGERDGATLRLLEVGPSPLVTPGLTRGPASCPQLEERSGTPARGRGDGNIR